MDRGHFVLGQGGNRTRMGSPPADLKVDPRRPGCPWKLPRGPFLSPHYGCGSLLVVLLATASCCLISPVLRDYLRGSTQQTLTPQTSFPPLWPLALSVQVADPLEHVAVVQN